MVATRVTGSIIRHMVKANFVTQQVMFMKGCGLITKLMGSGFIQLQTVLSTRVHGGTTTSMETVSRPLLVVQSMKANTPWETKTDKVSTPMQMEQSTKGSGTMESSRA